MDAMDKGQIVLIAGYVLTGIAAFIIARLLVHEQETRAAQENLADLRDRKASNALVKFARPFFTQYVVPMIRGKAFWDKRRQVYKRKLISGGLKEELTPDEFIAFKLFNIILFPLAGGFLKSGGFVDIGWFYIFLLFFAGWFYPDLWINSRIKKRQKQILRAMPFIVDLLALSTEAGLDFVGAIGKVVEKAAPSPLVEEFSQVLKEIKVGASRSEALREMGLRTGMTEMNSFVAILISADQMGASIGKILRQQSEQIRVQRMLMAEKAGAAASQKVLIPLMLFIVPSVFIMIIAPFILSWIYPNGTP
jgi:tight adherence protein C